MVQENNHPVVFVGAGPGDPDLITVKGRSALETADLIIYAGSLVPKALLKWKKEAADTMNSAGMNLHEIIEAVREAHDRGQKVVRLHTGDPSLYGAIAEQIRELEKYGIPVKVIPGVTAAFAAAAAMGMEYTLPEITQTLILTRISGRTPVPALESLDLLAQHQSSMAIYLSIAHVERVERIIVEHYGTKSLCAVAYKVGHPEETIVYTPAEHLSETVKTGKLNRQALIIVGKAVEAAHGKISPVQSRLYDAGFSHGFRKEKEAAL